MILRDGKLYAPLLMMWPAFPHSSFLSTILLMTVPVALYLRYSPSPTLPKREGVEIGKQITMIEMLLGILAPIVFTVLSGARIGMLIVPALLVLGYLFYCTFKPAIKWGFAIAGIVAMGVIFHSFPNIDDRFSDPIRVDLRKNAISAYMEKSVLGWGTGSAQYLIKSEERARSLGLETPYDFRSFHNQYLHDLAQFGISGLLILLVLFGWMLWIGLREKNFLLLSLLAIYALFCFTESALFTSKGIVPFTYWVCFLTANRKNTEII